MLIKHLGRQLFHQLHQLEFLAEALFPGQLAGVLLENDGAGIADGVDRMAHAVDLAGTVARLAPEDFEQIIGHLALVVPVFHVGP